MNEDARFVLPLETTMNVFDLFLFFSKLQIDELHESNFI